MDGDRPLIQVDDDAATVSTELTRVAIGVSNNSAMPKWCKTVIAILLLPVCAGAVSALWSVVRASGNADTIWVATLSGAACWVVIYLLLPKPMWVYVLGHELTHAVWAWLFGGRVRRFKVTSDGGQVSVSKTNFLIALSPYFFPLYALLVVAVFMCGYWFWGWQREVVWFHLLLGAAYSFHVTLTWHILKNHQSDIAGQGYVFSAVVIFLGNALVLLLGIAWLTAKVEVGTALRWWVAGTAQALQWLERIF
jgi:hypothetical protein